MITKDQLEELIKQDSVLYWLFRDDILLVDTTLINKIYGDVAIEYLDATYNCNLTVNISDLYENREDVAEKREFGSVFRTERLEFPNWEDVKDKGVNVYFDNPRKDISYELYIDIVKSGIFVEKNDEVIFLASLSRENYNEARKLCVKLFKGESDG